MMDNTFEFSKLFKIKPIFQCFITIALILLSSNFYAQSSPEEISKKLTDLYGVTHMREEQYAKDLTSNKIQVENSEESLKDASDDKGTLPETLKSLKKELGQLLQIQKIIITDQKENKKLLTKIESLINESPEKQAKFISSYEEKMDQLVCQNLRFMTKF